MSRRAEIEALFDSIIAAQGAALRRVAGIYERDSGRRDDLFQEICLAIWRALPGFRAEASPRTFVFRIAHNRGLTHRWRARRSAVGSMEEALDLPDRRPNPEEAAQAHSDADRLRAAVHALPLPIRQAVSLALEGLTNREIGEVLGISDGNVAVRLTRGRALLREALSTREKRS
ncbi:MAG: sigma-70 family RNA polymerase sigma factor [Acidobacteria bacterium]|nr:sigma-70 family RNA polymerase sigma factor [Acidobacteriota bacterium]